MTTLKVNVIRKPTIKVKVLPNFPSSVTVTSPILLSRVGGNFAFSFDQGALGGALIVNADNITLGSQTGTGAMVRAISPSLVTPDLGTPSAAVLTNATGTAAGLTAGHVTTNANLSGDVTSVGNTTTLATVNANVGTFGSATQSIQITANAKGLLTAAANVTITPAIGSITGLGAGVAAFLATPSSANLIAAVTDETGTGALVFANTPTLVTPVLGAATATSINKVAFTAPATAATLTILNNKTATFNNSITFAGTDATTMTFPTTTATLARTDAANTFTGHQTIEGVTSTGATGTGKFVFDTSPILVTPALGTPSSGVATNITGLPLSGLTTQAAFTFVGNNTGGSAVPTAVDIHTLTLKASPAATDEVIISDQAASGAWKRSPVSSLASASGVASIAGNTGAFTLGIGLTNSVNDIRTSLTSLTNSLGADVALSNIANYFDGPSVAQGTSGTWFVSGSVTVVDTVGNAAIHCKLWDGTTVIASGIATTGGTGFQECIALSGFIASPAGNLRISCKDPNSTSGKIQFNSTGNSKDSTISAIRIA